MIKLTDKFITSYYRQKIINRGKSWFSTNIIRKYFMDALAEKLATLLATPDLRQRLGSAAREKVIGEFGTQEQIYRFLSFYHGGLQTE